ncbi:VRR-NUC domain-containing protein [Burkholderia cenocepacia]|uniref:VRR-NUC domain-containing protein n=1 Tax=Burkholderia cenocepacia TaxID=95486 RepID=UPI0028621CE5|nr:VRR-NUC domain-containing protein [Burkholderia cenocepacia]MDR8026468.1 VRR-NUC domain-containing protein [Burkholderia cenocepacia]MDR8043709.1 VRR-NUC domain-containing protein [Burkholderia cenocepacia]
MRESDIENYLVARVKALGGEVRKVKWIGRRGAPDRIVMLPARSGYRAPLTVWVELKAPGVPPEAHQVREHERMRAAGQYVEVVDSFSRVDEVLA